MRGRMSAFKSYSIEKPGDTPHARIPHEPGRGAPPPGRPSAGGSDAAAGDHARARRGHPDRHQGPRRAQARGRRPVALGTAASQGKVADPSTATLRSDLEYAGAFAVTDPAHYPSGFRDPTTPEAADRWLGTGAEVLVDTRGEVAGDRVSVEARVWDLKSRKLILGRRYSGGASYVDRIAHTLANDLVKYFTGKTGAFLSTILFVGEGRGRREMM